MVRNTPRNTVTRGHSPATIVRVTPPSHVKASDQNAAVTASFLGWTLDAFDYFLVVYGLTAIARDFHRSDKEMALAITITLAFRPIGAFLFGLLADRYGRRGVMLWPRVLLTLTTWPLFLLLVRQPTATNLYVATIVLTGLTALSSAASLIVIPELLPRSIRVTGLSIAYAVGVSLFGGTTQFIVTWLQSVTRDPTSPAWYVTATSLITLVAMWVLPESRDRDLDA